MNNTVRNILVVIIGCVFGGMVNGLLIKYGHNLVPYPEGIDMSDPDSLAKNISLLKPANFAMVFLAHALGTLFASIVIARYAASHQYKLAMIPGLVFLAGGIMMTQMVDAPTWFDATDLLIAYLPMAWLGYKIGINSKS